jgi:phosphoglycerate kinase
MSLELSFLGPAVNAPARPFCLVLGGAKISSKLPLLRSMMSKCDKILVGGGMAFTFLRAAGFGVGKSLVEESLVQTARDIIQLAEQAAVELVLPRDVVVTHSLYKDATPTPPSAQPVPVVTSPSASSDVVLVDDIPDDMMGVDVGPATLRAFCAELETCKTVLWNGACRKHVLCMYFTSLSSL